MMQQHGESRWERALAQAFAELRPHGVVSAYLFGSAAEAREHSESDLDVALVMDRRELPRPEARFAAAMRLSAELQARLQRSDLDLVVLDDAPPVFARRVLAGVRVYCTSEDRDRDFRRDVQLKAADLEPYLRRMRAIKLEALAP